MKLSVAPVAVTEEAEGELKTGAVVSAGGVKLKVPAKTLFGAAPSFAATNRVPSVLADAMARQSPDRDWANQVEPALFEANNSVAVPTTRLSPD